MVLSWSFESQNKAWLIACVSHVKHKIDKTKFFGLHRFTCSVLPLTKQKEDSNSLFLAHHNQINLWALLSHMNVTLNDKAILHTFSHCGFFCHYGEIVFVGLYKLFPVVLFQLCGGLLFGSGRVLNKREIIIHFAC